MPNSQEPSQATRWYEYITRVTEGMTARDVAARAGFDESAMTRWKKGMNADPKFVLEFKGKIYVTLGVLEYDPLDEEMDDDARSDLSELQAMLAGSRPVSGTVYGPPQVEAAIAQSESRDGS